MKKSRYIKLFLIFYLSSITAYATSSSSPDINKLGEAMQLNCKTFGNDSCTSRFIAMSACTFAYGIAKSNKTVKESFDIADNLFVLLMRGNGLNPNDMFDDQNLVKKSIRSETIERVDKCKEWTKEAIPKIVLERTGKEATPEFIDGATKTFGMWWLNSLEGVKRGN